MRIALVVLLMIWGNLCCGQMRQMPQQTPGIGSGELNAESTYFNSLDSVDELKAETFAPAKGVQPDSEPSKVFDPTAKLTGFFQLDMGYYGQDAANVLTLGDIEDSLGFRRARLAAKGRVTENTEYILEFDIAQAQARFVDVWMQFNKTKFGNIRIGRFRQPYGMSELTSVRELPFLERPLTFALSPFRQTGVMLFDHSKDENRTWAIAGYRYLSDNFGNVYSDGGYGLSTRLTALPISWGDERHFHVGVDYSVSSPGRGQVLFVSTNEFFGAQNPNIGLASLSVLPIVGVPPFVNTGRLDADLDQFFNVEMALALGRMAVQSETRWTQVEQTGGGTLTFPAAYLLTRFMLTGEKIPYSKSNGTFGRIEPVATGCKPMRWTRSVGTDGPDFLHRPQ